MLGFLMVLGGLNPCRDLSERAAPEGQESSLQQGTPAGSVAPLLCPSQVVPCVGLLALLLVSSLARKWVRMV